MRWTLVLLLSLGLGLQYQLWFTHSGHLNVRKNQEQLAKQKEDNSKLEQRNAGLEAEVRDLKTGYGAIEERARFELGLTKVDEVYVQIPPKN